MSRFLVIVNPIAGRGQGMVIAPQVADGLRAAGHNVRMTATGAAGDAYALVMAEGDWADAVVVVGGDGSISEVLHGRGERRFPLGIVPLGTGNVLAKELKIPRDPQRALAVICRGHTRTIDLGKLTDGRFFSCVLSAGIEGDICRRLAAARSGPIHMLDYIGLMLRSLGSANYRAVRIEADGALVARDISYAACANTHSFGGPFEIVEQALCDDGQLDILTAHGDIAMSYPTMLAMAFFRQMQRFSGVRTQRCRHVVLASARGVVVPYQMDGEYAGDLPVEFQVVERALEVFVAEAQGTGA